MTLRAVLWDMDGLLVDSEPVWTVAEIELAAELGGVWSDELKAQIAGTRLDVAVPTILAFYGADPSRSAWAQDWLLTRMVELFRAEPPLLPGVLDLLAAVTAEGLPQALVSSSYRVLVDAVLSHGMGPFALTLTGDEVTRGKPDPEPYLTAAARLGVAPQDCVVLEDSRAGVQSGLAAGCAVVAVPSVAGVGIVPGNRLWVRASAREISVDDLRHLVARAPEVIPNDAPLW